MSRAAEEAYERRHADLVAYYEVGAKVWRAEWHRVGEWRIREGEVDEVERVTFCSLRQRFEPDPRGDSLRWSAKFPRYGGSFDWFSQTSEHEFFASREGALRQLAWDMKRRAENCDEDAAKWRAAIARAEQASRAEAG